MPARNRANLRRKLTIESLEARQLMAADTQWSSALLPAIDVGEIAVDDRSLAHHAVGDAHLCAVKPIDVLPAAATAATIGGAAALAAATYPLSSIPILNSLPGAAATLFLDFDGHFDARWGDYRNISTPAFDIDGDPGSFSDAELTTIRQVWQTVAEDYAPFNINVTTAQPASFADRVAQRVAIGGNGAWLGDRVGGVSYIDSFTDPFLVNTSYVFPKNLANGYWKYVAEVSSHEAGHGFGLEHIGAYDGAGRLIDEYYTGPGDGRAPIMGDSDSAVRGVWWAGSTSLSIYDFQDDMNRIARPANGFGYRPDDHANSIAGATPLVAVGNTVSAAGVIMIMADVDYFSFSTGAGQVSFSAVVPAGFNNLDTRLELRDAAGTLITSAAPWDSFNATVNATLNAGTYYVAVGSQGNYGDIGQYTLVGTLVPAVSATLAAPSNLAVTRGPGFQAALNWSDNSSGESGYVVERRSDIATQWAVVATPAANAASFVDANVVAGRVYEYRVKTMSGASGSAYSNVAGTAFAPIAPANLSATVASGRQVNLAWGNVTGEIGYKIERAAAGSAWSQIAAVSAEVLGFQDLTVQPSTAYQYRVRAYNYGGDSAASNPVSVTTPAGVAQLPGAPFGLTAAVISSQQVNLHWYDNSNNESWFVVQRSTDGVSWTAILQLPANTTSVADFSTTRRTTYYYRVLALNEVGYSAPTNVVGVRTPSFATLAGRTVGGQATLVGSSAAETVFATNDRWHRRYRSS